MIRSDTFAFRINQNERRMISTLSKHFQRSQSDTLRLLIRSAVKEIKAGANETESHQTEPIISFGEKQHAN